MTIEHWAAKTEEYEAALETRLDGDERLAEYAEAVAGLREAARADQLRGAVEAGEERVDNIMPMRSRDDRPTP